MQTYNNRLTKELPQEILVVAHCNSHEQEETVAVHLTVQVATLTGSYNQAVLPAYKIQRTALLETEYDTLSERTRFVNMVK